MGNTTSSLNLFATCLPQHPTAEQQQQTQKGSFNPTPVDDDQDKSDDWDSDFSDHFDEQKESKNEVKESSKINGQALTNHTQQTEKVATAPPMRLEKKDKESTGLKLSKEKEPANPTPESSDKTLNEPTTSLPSSPKHSPQTVSPKQVSRTPSTQTNQDTSNTNTAEPQDVDFFSDMTPQYVAPKKIQIQPKPQPVVQQPQQAKIKIDLENANKPESLDAVGWDEEEIQIEADVDGIDDTSNPSKEQPKRDRKKKSQTKESKQKPARLTAVKLKSTEAFEDDFEDEPTNTNS